MQVTKDKNYLPLVDKYKPKNIDNVILTPHLRIKINKIIDKKYINNTMIVGETGAGKMDRKATPVDIMMLLAKLESQHQQVDRTSFAVVSPGTVVSFLRWETS